MTRGDKPPPLEELDARLKAAKAQRSGGSSRREKADRRSTGEMGAALRVAVDLVAGIAVGTAIGWGLDRWFGTTPWLLLLFFILGAAAGFRNVYKTAQQLSGIDPKTGRPMTGDDGGSDTKVPPQTKEEG